MDALAPYSGWLALVVILAAGMVPLAVRVYLKRRAAVETAPVRLHTAVGITAAAVAGLHTLLALPALGDPAAIEAGSLAFVIGSLGFLVVVAHVGIGLQLKVPALKDRLRKRRLHVLTASTLVALTVTHAWLLMRSK
jgi:hypothetical protein